MDKIAKALQRLSDQERRTVKELLNKIQQKDLKNLDLKKLKGYQDIFRARKGRVRVIFIIEDKGIYILAIERRSDTTYNL